MQQPQKNKNTKDRKYIIFDFPYLHETPIGAHFFAVCAEWNSSTLCTINDNIRFAGVEKRHRSPYAWKKRHGCLDTYGTKHFHTELCRLNMECTRIHAHKKKSRSNSFYLFSMPLRYTYIYHPMSRSQQILESNSYICIWFLVQGSSV